MRSKLYWIEGPWPGQLAVLPRPRGNDWLEDEVTDWRAQGIDLVVSALEEEETHELGIGREAELCRAKGIEFISFPIPDWDVPGSRVTLGRLAHRLEKDLEAGKNIAIHCRQGVGRSAMLAASILAEAGIGPEAAFERIRSARGCDVPDTPEQRESVIRFVREHLARVNGE